MTDWSMSIVLNFSHPLTAEQFSQLAALIGETPARVIDVPVAFDHARPFAEQVRAATDAVGLSMREWQGERLVVNPASLAAICATLLAEVHGRCGYFPPVVRMRPVAGAVPPRFEIAEVIDLNHVRDAARRERSGESGE